MKENTKLLMEALSSYVFDEVYPNANVIAIGNLTCSEDHADARHVLRLILAKASVENKLLELLQGLDILGLFKMYSYMESVKQNPKYHPEGSLLAQMHMVLKVAEDKCEIVKIGALVHDFGKPISYAVNGNTYDHHFTGIPFIVRFCELMGICEDVKLLISTASYNHIKAHQVIGQNKLTHKKLRGLLIDLKCHSNPEFFEKCLQIFECDLLGRGGVTNTESVDYLRALARVTEGPYKRGLEAFTNSIKAFIKRRSYTPYEKLKLPVSSMVSVARRDWVAKQIEENALVPVSINIVGSVLQDLNDESSDLDILCIYRDRDFEPTFTERLKSTDLNIEMSFRPLSSIPSKLEKSDGTLLDLLWSDSKYQLYSSALWDKIVSLRKDVVAKNMHSLTSFIYKFFKAKVLVNDRRYLHSYIIDQLDAIDTDTVDKDIWDSIVSNYDGKLSFGLFTKEGNDKELLIMIDKKSYNMNLKKKFLLNVFSGQLSKMSGGSSKLDTKAILHAVRSAHVYASLINTMGESMDLDTETLTYLKTIKAGEGDDIQAIKDSLDLIHKVEATENYSSLQELPNLINIKNTILEYK